jgi:NAD(P)-dependent dehydrogenase (short-subunit alcohol dehydrogenase family)
MSHVPLGPLTGPADILVTGQVVVITGGGQGLGEAMARGFARFGAKPVVIDLRRERAESVAAALTGEGYDALGLCADARKPEDMEGVAEQALARFGRIDILVNNAASVRKAAFVDMSVEQWRKQIDANMGSMLTATGAILPKIIAGARGGSILNVASMEGFRAAPGFSVYAACKAGMINFTRSLALELSHLGIRVNCLAPDIIETPGIAAVAGGGVPEPFKRYIPMGRFGQPDEFASAALFLASPMGRYITGVTLNVDGGTFASSGWVRDQQGGWRVAPS